jgi:hypothetical protein
MEKHMQKLKLRLEDLQVDTFQITAARREKGTVFGEQCTCYTQCTCPGCPTCDASCNGTCNCPGGTGGGTGNASCDFTCEASCNGTCDDTCAGSCASCQFSCDDMYTCANGVYGLVC